MTSYHGNQALELLAAKLAVHRVDESVMRFRAEEMLAYVEGRRIYPLDVLAEVVADFASGAQRLSLPDRAVDLEDQALILDRWGPAFEALDALRALSAGIGLHCDELAASGLERSDEALSKLFWGAHVIASEVLTVAASRLCRRGRSRGGAPCTRWTSAPR